MWAGTLNKQSSLDGLNSPITLYNVLIYIVYRESFTGENFRELLKVGLSQLKLSRLVGNDNDTPIDNDAAVLNENFRGLKHSQIASKPQNLRKFSPAKDSRYTVSRELKVVVSALKLIFFGKKW